MSGFRMPRAGNAERFAALLAAGPGGRTDAPASLRRMLTITDGLAALPAPVFNPDASARIRQRLVAVATVQAAAPAEVGDEVRRRRFPHRRLATAAVGGVAALTAVTGVAVAASNALPGDLFYGVKRAAEAVQLDLTFGNADKGHRELEFAATRLSELRAIGVRDPNAASVLADMRSETASGQHDLASAAQSEQSTAPLREFESFAASQAAGLTKLAAGAPSSLLPDLHQTITQLVDLDAVTNRLGIKLPGAPLPGLPPVLSPGGSSSPLAPGAAKKHAHHKAHAGGTTRHSKGSGGGHGLHILPSIGPSGGPGKGSGGGSGHSILPSLPLPTSSQKLSIPPLPSLLPTPSKLPTKLPTSLPSLPIISSLLPSSLGVPTGLGLPTDFAVPSVGARAQRGD